MKIGDVIFDTVYGIFNGMISVITGGFVSDFFSEDMTVAGVTERLLAGLRDRTVELIETAGETIADATTDLTNAIAKNFADVLGITALQQRIAERFEAEMEARIGLFEKEAELLESAEEAAARELATRTMSVLSDRAEYYQDQYATWLGSFIEMNDEAGKLQFETSMAGLDMAQHLLDIDVTMIHDLAAERNVAAVIGMTTEIEESIKTADVWAREIGIKPLAYGEMALNVLSSIYDLTPEEVAAQLDMMVQASYKVAGDMIPAFKPGVGE